MQSHGLLQILPVPPSLQGRREARRPPSRSRAPHKLGKVPPHTPGPLRQPGPLGRQTQRGPSPHDQDADPQRGFLPDCEGVPTLFWHRSSSVACPDKFDRSIIWLGLIYDEKRCNIATP